MTEISLKILDMECAACVARLDRVISRLHGVKSAQVNFTASSASITYDEYSMDKSANKFNLASVILFGISFSVKSNNVSSALVAIVATLTFAPNRGRTSTSAVYG